MTVSNLMSRYAFVALLLGYFTVNLQAQIPDKFTNLQVLPNDISQGELLATMRSFALGLGVRCWHCHVGEEGIPLSEFDFAADAKDTKKKARVMIEMRDAISKQFLTKLDASRDPMLEVECVTCHRGQAKPRMLEDVLYEEITMNGTEACIAKYRDLREQYYGGFAYDFGEFTLIFLTDRLAKQEQKVDEAIALLQLNTEFYPKSWTSYFGLGEMYAMKGDHELALKNYRKANEISPNPRIQLKVDELSAK